MAFAVAVAVVFDFSHADVAKWDGWQSGIMGHMFERSEFVSHPTGARLIWGPANGGQRLCDRLFAYFLGAQLGRSKK